MSEDKPDCSCHHDPEIMKAQLELVERCIEVLGDVINSIAFEDDEGHPAETIMRAKMHNSLMAMLVACRSIGSGLDMDDDDFARACAHALTFAANHVVTAKLQEAKIH